MSQEMEDDSQAYRAAMQIQKLTVSADGGRETEAEGPST
jgi:hypothetical protein